MIDLLNRYAAPIALLVLLVAVGLKIVRVVRPTITIPSGTIDYEHFANTMGNALGRFLLPILEPVLNQIRDVSQAHAGIITRVTTLEEQHDEMLRRLADQDADRAREAGAVEGAQAARGRITSPGSALKAKP